MIHRYCFANPHSKSGVHQGVNLALMEVSERALGKSLEAKGTGRAEIIKSSN